MRPVLAASLALVLLVSVLPAEAHPLPKTEQATRELVKDVLADTDESGAKMLRDAKKLLRTIKGTVDGVGVPPLPGTPALPSTEQGALEIRTTLVQPGVRGHDMTLGAMWLGSSHAYWTGVYWIESDGAGQVLPNVMDVNENGLILFVDGGSLALGESVNVTYHFLGLDGQHIVQPLGAIPILPAMPVLDRMDLGGAHASTRGKDPEAIFLTPWNLYDHNVTAGMTIFGGDEVLEEEIITACADWQAQVIEPGCRLLYLLPLADAATSLQLWSLDADGERIVEREVTRAQLEAGVTFTP